VRTYHFIAGLPRSGSTLLAAILNQNPAFRAGMSSPVFGVFNACLTAMGGSNEYALFLNDRQKANISRGIFDGYYSALTDAQPTGRVFFDTNRMWPARLPALRLLYPGARIICCVRNPAWILDSIEQLIRKNALDTSRMFGSDAERISVYSRTEALMHKGRLVGSAFLALKEAYHGADAKALLLLDYDTLVTHPKDAIKLVYLFLGEPDFEHDFENVSYQAEEFDTQLLAKGLHQVRGRVEKRVRPTILPPEVFQKYAGMNFWNKGGSLAHTISARK